MLIRMRPVLFVLEATSGFEPLVEVLQTPALPLGYVALWIGQENITDTRRLVKAGAAR